MALVSHSGTILTFTAIVVHGPGQCNFQHWSVGALSVYLRQQALRKSPPTDDQAGGLWSGTLATPIDTDLLGAIPNHQFTYTGTGATGTSAPFPLGTASPAVGTTHADNNAWIHYGNAEDNVPPLPLYAISQPLTVSVPEPASIVLCLSAASCACGRAAVRAVSRGSFPACTEPFLGTLQCFAPSPLR